MKKKVIYDVLVGSVMASIIALIIIFSIENEKSLFNIFLGFVVFVIPFTFITSFFSRTGSFLFVFISILIVYAVEKLVLNDFWIGSVMALIFGGGLFYFKVFSYKPFSRSKYINKNEHNE